MLCAAQLDRMRGLIHVSTLGTCASLGARVLPAHEQPNNQSETQISGIVLVQHGDIAAVCTGAAARGAAAGSAARG